MEPEKQNEEITIIQPPDRKNEKHFVYTLRDWKEYLGESMLIMFSVVLALILTEYFNKLHEKENTKILIENIRNEMVQNKKALEEIERYNLPVLKRIDAVLESKRLQSEIVSNDEFHLDIIAPEGVLYRYFEDAAWTIAKNNNISSKVDIETISLITRIYGDLERILKVEDEVARIFFDRASRDPKQIHTTLILIRDIYHAWAVDRVPGLLIRVNNVIKKIDAH